TLAGVTRFPDVALPSGVPPRPQQALSGLPMPLTISAKLLFVDIVRSSCPFK
ncbi:hypothetical protein L210DRAFT_3515112, partial [Boletus edulis BED1]